MRAHSDAESVPAGVYCGKVTIAHTCLLIKFLEALPMESISCTRMTFSMNLRLLSSIHKNVPIGGAAGSGG